MIEFDTDICDVCEKFPPKPKPKTNTKNNDFGLPYKGCFLAGGALTSRYTAKPVNDYDLYPKSVDDRAALIEALFDDGYYNYHSSDRALTFVADGIHPIQVMIFDVFPTADVIFDFFDFTINMAAIDLDTEEVILHDDFLTHNSQRYLHFNPATKFPYASMMRVKKYQERGYSISQGQTLKILKACANSPITSWENLKSQMGGIYGDSIDISDDLEFNDENVFNVLDNLVIVKNPIGYRDYDDYMMNNDSTLLYYDMCDSNVISTCKTYAVFKWNVDNGDYDIYHEHTPPKLGTQIFDLRKIYKDGIINVYKSVNLLNDGTYTSHYKSSFKYNVGETVSEEKSPYMFFKRKYEDAKNYFSGYGKNSAVLKVSIDVNDIKGISDTEITATKAFIIEKMD